MLKTDCREDGTAFCLLPLGEKRGRGGATVGTSGEGDGDGPS